MPGRFLGIVRRLVDDVVERQAGTWPVQRLGDRDGALIDAAFEQFRL